MKTIKFLGLTILAALTLVACQDKKAEREPSPIHEGPSVFFATSTVSKEYDPAQGVNTDTLTICRKDPSGALEVAINVLENTDDIFTVPATVTFEDGDDEVDFVIKGFLAGEAGKTYSLTLTVDEASINPYVEKLSEITYSVTNLAWRAAEFPSVWVDNSWTGAYGMETQIWYVNYEYVLMSNGSAKYRFLNPYASHPSNWDPTTQEGTPDNYGVYDGFPSNYPGDYDEEGTYNGVVSVDASGKASWTSFNTGVDWGYGQFLVGNLCIDFNVTEDAYPLGKLSNNVISFPDQSMYLYIPGMGGYPGGTCDIYLDCKKYQEDHSVKHIADLEGKFNDASIEWDIVPGGTSILQSEAFDFLEDRFLLKAHNMDEAAGDKSEFINLYMVADAFAEGYGLAFYWDQEKNKISVPEQEIGVNITASKKVLVKDNGSVVTDSTLVGVDVTAFVFNLKFITDAQGEIGDFTESFFIGEEAIKFSKKSYLGWWNFNCNLSGEDAVLPTLFSDGEKDTIWIDGIVSESLYALYDDESAAIVLPSQVMEILDLTPYDLGAEELTLLVSYDAAGDPVGDDLILKLGLSGNIELVNTGLYGFYQWVNSIGAYLDYWDIYNFTPGVAPAPGAPRKAAHHGLNTSLVKEHKAQPSGLNMKNMVEKGTYNVRKFAPKSAQRFF